MSISRGSNVCPRKVEEPLLLYDVVRGVSVRGTPDQKWDEPGVAVALLREGSNATPEALLAHLGARLAHYECPRHLVFWYEPPKSAHGKITQKGGRQRLARECERHCTQAV